MHLLVIFYTFCETKWLLSFSVTLAWCFCSFFLDFCLLGFYYFNTNLLPTAAIEINTCVTWQGIDYKLHEDDKIVSKHVGVW